MFGYIAPDKDELKVRELTEYNAFYCGLCKAIGRRYSQAARLSLSYDCAYLALLVSGLSPCTGYTKERCCYKPLRKLRPVARASAVLDFAADVNVLLSWYKLDDDWRDERKLSALLGKWLLGGAKCKAVKHAPELAGIISRGIAAVSDTEKRGSREIDEAAHEFAAMLSEIAARAPLPKEDSAQLSAFCFDLGRWLYLIDAWDDRAKDEKSGSYNVFSLCRADKERAGFVLNCNINEAIKLYDILDIRSHKGLLDNIIYLGIVKKTIGILAAEE